MIKQAIKQWLGLEELDREVKTLSVTSFASVEAIKDLQAKINDKPVNVDEHIKLTLEE